MNDSSELIGRPGATPKLEFLSDSDAELEQEETLQGIRHP